MSLELSRRSFAYWDIDENDWVVAPGDYTVQVCRDSATVSLENTVSLDGDNLVRALTLDSTVQEWWSHPVVGRELLATLASGPAEVPQGGESPADLMRMVASMPMRTVIMMLGDAAPVDALEKLMARSRSRRRKSVQS